MARLVGGTLDLSRQLLAPPPRGCTAVPASSRPHPKFIVVAAHFEGARRLRRSFAGVWETSYGRPCPVPYRIISRQQPHEGQVLALLLSCPLIWSRFSASLRHRHFSSVTVMRVLFHAGPRRSAKVTGTGTTCTLPRSSTAGFGCTSAALEPSRRMSLSNSRGSITGIRARSSDAGRRQDIVLPVFLVCTIPLPPGRTS